MLPSVFQPCKTKRVGRSPLKLERLNADWSPERRICGTCGLSGVYSSKKTLDLSRSLLGTRFILESFTLTECMWKLVSGIITHSALSLETCGSRQSVGGSIARAMADIMTDVEWNEEQFKRNWLMIGSGWYLAIVDYWCDWRTVSLLAN